MKQTSYSWEGGRGIMPVAHLVQQGRGMAEAVMERLQVRERVAGSLRTLAAAAGNYTPRGRYCTPGVCPEEEVYYPSPTEWLALFTETSQCNNL